MSFNPSSGKYFQLKLMMFLVLVVFGWLLFAYASLVYKGYTIELKKSWFVTENTELEAQNTALAKQYEYLQTPDFLVREAKRKLNKREEGEKVLVLTDAQDRPEGEQHWWVGLQSIEVWWHYFFGVSVYGSE